MHKVILHPLVRLKYPEQVKIMENLVGYARKFEPEHDKTQQNDLSTQQRLISAWVRGVKKNSESEQV